MTRFRFDGLGQRWPDLSPRVWGSRVNGHMSSTSSRGGLEMQRVLSGFATMGQGIPAPERSVSSIRKETLTPPSIAWAARIWDPGDSRQESLGQGPS